MSASGNFTFFGRKDSSFNFTESKRPLNPFKIGYVVKCCKCAQQFIFIRLAMMKIRNGI